MQGLVIKCLHSHERRTMPKGTMRINRSIFLQVKLITQVIVAVHTPVNQIQRQCRGQWPALLRQSPGSMHMPSATTRNLQCPDVPCVRCDIGRGKMHTQEGYWAPQASGFVGFLYNRIQRLRQNNLISSFVPPRVRM